jgi:hypothetical protein
MLATADVATELEIGSFINFPATFVSRSNIMQEQSDAAAIALEHYC